MAATVIAVYSTKGGVGKTTTAVNLAWQAASEGREVLLWDLDPQAAATWLLQVKPHLRGGAEALVRGRKPANKAVRESKLDRIDVLPADESYRDLDIALDAAKKSTSRVTEALRPLRGTTTSSSSTPRRGRRWSPRTRCAQRTSSFCRSSRRRWGCARWRRCAV